MYAYAHVCVCEREYSPKSFCHGEFLKFNFNIFSRIQYIIKMYHFYDEVDNKYHKETYCV